MTARAPHPDPADPYALVQAVSSALPDNYTVEYDGLRIIAHARPKPRTNRAASSLYARLCRGFDPNSAGPADPGGWWLELEPELHLGSAHKVTTPDLAGWRLAALGASGPACCVAHGYYEQPPDWVCEVLSPSTEADDRGWKLDLYAAAGVGHVWLLDAHARTVEVLRRAGVGYGLVVRHDDTAAVRAEPFEAGALDLGALWTR